jgi:hypothetical protein
MDEFSKYESLREQGASPKDVYLTAKADGCDAITLLRVLRRLFALSIPQAKEVALIADHSANSLDEFQQKLVPGLEQSFSHAQDDGAGNGAATEEPSASRSQE